MNVVEIRDQEAWMDEGPSSEREIESKCPASPR